MEKTEVQNYQFSQFVSEEDSKKSKSGVSEYKIKDLNENVIGSKENIQKIIKLERNHATKNEFKFSDIVEKHRGIKAQREHEEEQRLNHRVEEKVTEIQEHAFEKGFEKGAEKGQGKAYTEFKEKVDDFSEKLEQMILDVRGTEEKILKAQKKNVYELIRGMAKWVILRELRDDGKYLDRLLEKLIYELNTRSNVIVQVNQRTFETMDLVLESVQKKIGTLDNVRVEILPELEDHAIVLETENGILDASLSEQFSSLDKIFESLDLINE